MNALTKEAVPKRSVLIREMTFEDYDRVAALHTRHGTNPRSRDQWTRLWHANPAWLASGNQMPIGWVLETDRCDIVGSLANFAFAYLFRGRMLRVAASGDWFVDPPYRGYSLQMLAHWMNQPGADLVVTTTASPVAEAAFRQFGGRRVPVGNWDKSAFWVTNHRGFASVALRAASAPLVPVLSPLLGAALWLTDAGVRRIPHSDVELCAEFDSRFDDFWGELKAQNEEVLLGVRTRDILAWHFGHLTPGQSRWILTASKGRRITAYAVFDRKDNLVRGLTRVRVIDFQALKGYEHLIRSFLAWMADECHRHGIDVIEDFGCWLRRPDLPRVKTPHRRCLPSWTFYYSTNDEALAKELENPRVWVPSNFDGDIGL